jgi:hypothetical protein
MSSRQNASFAVATLLLLSACGSGSGGGVASAPTPTPTPTPTTAAPAVKIFENPTPQEYAVVGASTTSAGDGYTPVAQDARLTQVSLENADQPRIRYNAGGYYEVQLPGSSFDRLIHYKGLADPTADSNFFQPQGAPQNLATLIVARSRLDGYNYSELASWTESPDKAGFMAFGVPTPPSAVPTTGQASFIGSAIGMVDVTEFDNLYGGYYFTGIGGEVRLNVDFASSTLDGLFSLRSGDGTAVGDFAITPTSLGSGTNGFQSSFATTQSGYNDFRGLFTGPNAQEAIGSWAVPVTISGQSHQAIGAWIARRGN